MTPTEALTALDGAARGAARDQGLGARRRRAGIRNWSQGGCAVYAEGLRRWLGSEAHLVGVHEYRDVVIDHVAVVWRGLYFDSHGVRDESDFLFDLESVGLFQAPQLVPLADAAAIPMIDFAPELVPGVVAALRARLDPALAMATLVSNN
jgi:hypothetical protein